MRTRHPYLDGPHPRAFAHRGWHVGELAGMENAMSAFRRAVAEGYHYLETDVHATADGVVVVHHDPVLDRTTDGRGPVAAQPWRRVSRARIGGREPVSRLEEVLEELPDTHLNVDVKADSAVAPVLRTLARTNSWHRVCLASFDERRLTRLRRAGGPRLITSLGPRSAGALWAGARLRGLAPRRVVRGQLAQLPRRHGRLTLVDRRLVRLAHRWGLEVHVWTVDRPAEMGALLDLGVDGLVTDRPDRLREVLRARGHWPATV
ncbi:glycerophosphoryl diester phosphodiesterase [Longimycelium tulufanense]|uniref:Glycerophosphoryl diester phosphodiesterase n=1 Tax=Longimycelium tulufanense TaxID=907463 RepID=A0A8J3CHN5_9PSEU|nr:glycerophosphodiester phosphodiesterase [Longimycelium tulufanense]GGM78852.1 glycerophosphoryl diester phosphodiesterase [Longimycelium tulufanense]